MLTNEWRVFIHNSIEHEMEEVLKVEEERRQKEEEMKSQFGLGENGRLLC
ncbi:phage protein [Proteus mirabilis HI4320]|uniref:Phage protein n=1 Tax=Proteus mirabilis (strain HI4320) TaxID=529507 RepID=B4ETG5_PROMH|nr:phage protein [Proteus mirabilis HI4320]